MANSSFLLLQCEHTWSPRQVIVGCAVVGITSLVEQLQVAHINGHCLIRVCANKITVTAVLTASGAVVPGAVAIVAPIGLGFAVQYGINPVLMGLMIINGATAGGFSPISVFGSIVNGVVERNDLAENATLLFASSFLFNLMLSVVAFFLFGGLPVLLLSFATFTVPGMADAHGTQLLLAYLTYGRRKTG